jgi:hypothetical protein
MLPISALNPEAFRVNLAIERPLRLYQGNSAQVAKLRHYFMFYIASE